MQIIRRWPRKGVEQGGVAKHYFHLAIGSRIGGKGYYVYSASKGAVNAMSLSLAVELAPGVRVNAVLPGTIETEMSRIILPTRTSWRPSRPSIPWVWAGGGRGRRGGIPVLRRARWITGRNCCGWRAACEQTFIERNKLTKTHGRNLHIDHRASSGFGRSIARSWLRPGGLILTRAERGETGSRAQDPCNPGTPIFLWVRDLARWTAR